MIDCLSSPYIVFSYGLNVFWFIYACLLRCLFNQLFNEGSLGSLDVLHSNHTSMIENVHHVVLYSRNFLIKERKILNTQVVNGISRNLITMLNFPKRVFTFVLSKLSEARLCQLQGGCIDNQSKTHINSRIKGIISLFECGAN